MHHVFNRLLYNFMFLNVKKAQNSILKFKVMKKYEYCRLSYCMNKASHKTPNMNDKTHTHTHINLLITTEKPDFHTGNLLWSETCFLVE